MGVHRSTDCGKTWQGPFEVTAATNPNGGLSPQGAPLDAADKEFMDVDPDTGRVIMSWSNFTPFAPGGVEIRTTYSDNMMAGVPPTWARQGRWSLPPRQTARHPCRDSPRRARRVRRVATVPVPGHVLRLRQQRRIRALRRQRRDVAGADRDQSRVLHRWTRCWATIA